MVKNPPANSGNTRDAGFDSWVRNIPWSRRQQPTPVFLPGKTRTEVGYSRWGHKESDTTEYACTIGEARHNNKKTTLPALIKHII